MFGRFIHKIKISVLTALKQNPATVKKKKILKNYFSLQKKKIKMSSTQF